MSDFACAAYVICSNCQIYMGNCMRQITLLNRIDFTARTGVFRHIAREMSFDFAA